MGLETMCGLIAVLSTVSLSFGFTRISGSAALKTETLIINTSPFLTLQPIATQIEEYAVSSKLCI